jgi:hypothetical protein
MRAMRSWVAVAVGLVALAVPAPAGGATQIGETFTPSGGCGDGTTRLQGTSPGGQYAAPFDGVITAWSFEAGPVVGEVRFRAAHPEGGNNFTIVGESDLKSPIPSQLNTYTDIRIPVRTGDVIGFYVIGFFPCLRNATGYQENVAGGDVTPGTTAPFDGEPNNHQLDVSALLEPDCDADGFGDETQDSELPFSAACGKGNRSLILDANKNKVKKGKKVTLSGRLTTAARQGPCDAGQTVELQRKRPKATTFTTIEQLQTTATGSFSTKRKVKKTFEYRAQVPETPTCVGQTSNTEKVKVKKKK